MIYYNTTDSPATIVAKDRLSVYTGRNTYLLGAAIYSDVGNLALDTGTLTFDNFHDVDTETSGGIGVSLSFSDTGVFQRNKSDAFGSFAYRNQTGITFATIGAGDITVRDAAASFNLDALNRDPDTMQVITSQTNFAIEIPGINLKRWSKQVQDSVDLIQSVTTKVPEHTRAQGALAVDLYRDMILRGVDPAIVREISASGNFKATVEARRKVETLIEQFGSLDNVPAEDLFIMALADGALYNAAGELRIPIDCSSSGVNCTIAANQFVMTAQVFIDELAAGHLPPSEDLRPLASLFQNFIKACLNADPQLVVQLFDRFGATAFSTLADAGSTAQASSNNQVGYDGAILTSAIQSFRASPQSPEDALAFQSLAQEAQVKFFNDNFDQALFDAAVANSTLLQDSEIDAILTVLGFVPIVGAAVDGYYLYYDYKTGNTVAMAVGVGMIIASFTGTKLIAKGGVTLIEAASPALKAGYKRIDDFIATEFGGLRLWSPTKKLDNVQNAHKHWIHHRDDFPEIYNATQYVSFAKAFKNAPPANTLSKVNARGDTVMYNHSSNTFAVYTPDGTPRTIFKPTPRSPTNPRGYDPNKYSSPLAYYNAQ